MVKSRKVGPVDLYFFLFSVWPIAEIWLRFWALLTLAKSFAATRRPDEIAAWQSRIVFDALI